ncbi:L-sorbosone dehydrogenase [Paracidovorax avenae ATCC 19860]|uniref:L-sorbosone dehydrogenase n=1 Tax=Paracidovorax avenae (strain ATCC 19860 / DSM 7227 / CCUG 15838 / JCM 20985 / LMG 2117 / NCPPB 1011) TaxID=643561 RepID=F0Q3Z1_PARA1|nr:sorbosone dehydrogenase family protein [Paracidovorax avenae]ADX46700.1 L-sorbosone dehydrogenase [Paracidovorax avenae ATCC 19860]
MRSFLHPLALRAADLARVAAPLVAVAVLAGCGDTARLPADAGIGPRPTLPQPNPSLIPTVHIAPAKGWPDGGAPQPMAGLSVTPFARGLAHPRWVMVLPNGDVLVAESDKPASEDPPPDDGWVKKVRNWVMGKVMARAGSGNPSANRITLLRDADGDGVAETRSVFLQGLNSPFGMALVGSDLYVANTDAVVRFPYAEGQTAITAAPAKVADLPARPLNHHWTKNLIASPDGAKLYVTVGSNSNVGENGMEAETGRAAIWEVDRATGTHRTFASGLRNPNGMGWEPVSGALWTVVNERDEIGSDLVPDYLTSVKDGGFYGWPYSYWGGNVDARVQPPRPDLVEKAIVPDYALGNHVAPLGMAFAGTGGPAAQPVAPQLAQGAFVGLHGSWNRKPRSGYKVVFVPFRNGKPDGMPLDVLTGFVSGDGDAWGRPVGVALDARGGLLVADDVGNTLWRVAAARP